MPINFSAVSVLLSCYSLWLLLPALVRTNVLERWTNSSPSLVLCCWRPTWPPEDWTFLTSTASSTTTSPHTPRYASAGVHIPGYLMIVWFDFDASLDLSALIGLHPQSRTNSQSRTVGEIHHFCHSVRTSSLMSWNLIGSIFWGIILTNVKLGELVCHLYMTGSVYALSK